MQQSQYGNQDKKCRSGNFIERVNIYLLIKFEKRTANNETQKNKKKKTKLT